MEEKYGCFLAISKHQSIIETFLYPMIFEKYPVFIHKKELLYVPLFGLYMHKMGMISIDRSSGKKALDKILVQAKIRKSENRPIIIFPEGTRAKPGAKPKYKSGFYQMYKELNLPILPMALNSGLFWPKGAKVIKPGVMEVCLLPEIETGLDKKELMEIIEHKIEKETNRLIY
jgi:1-acyl-sn-glycerol-3-phosphate acyltransferase